MKYIGTKWKDNLFTEFVVVIRDYSEALDEFTIEFVDDGSVDIIEREQFFDEFVQIA